MKPFNETTIELIVLQWLAENHTKSLVGQFGKLPYCVEFTRDLWDESKEPVK